MILVTGGCGYIGSHTSVELLSEGEDIVVLDNLSNSHINVVKRIELLADKKLRFVHGDVSDESCLRSLFENYDISSVIHFAGWKVVFDSLHSPLDYYDNNVAATLNLLKIMNEFNCKKIVFSSSASVYGDSSKVPICEDSIVSPVTPYARSKVFIEHILRDIVRSDDQWSALVLRYFNPVGAHVSGLIGEDLSITPNSLMQRVAEVALGYRKTLEVFGCNYPTSDGTGVRDYIHVVDLAKGHLAASNLINNHNGFECLNLGTGCGYSVLDLVQAFEKASGRHISCTFTERREGDVAVCYANPERAQKMLGWEANYGLGRICEDAWRWYTNNPIGYKDIK